MHEGCGERWCRGCGHWHLPDGQCTSVIGNGKPFTTGFRPVLLKRELYPGNIYVVLEPEKDWTGETRARVIHVEVAVRP